MTNDRGHVARRRAIVIGGSTSGLLVAALFQRQGWHADVFERSPVDLVGRGAGIVCHPDLFDALEQSGAGTSSLGVEVVERIAFNKRGEIVGRRAFPQTVTSWDRLYQLVRNIVPDASYHLDKTLTRVEQNARGVRATFDGGGDGRGGLADRRRRLSLHCSSAVSSFSSTGVQRIRHLARPCGRVRASAGRQRLGVRAVYISFPGEQRDPRLPDRGSEQRPSKGKPPLQLGVVQKGHRGRTPRHADGWAWPA